MCKFKKDKKRIFAEGGKPAVKILLYGTYNRARDELLPSSVYHSIIDFNRIAREFEAGETSLATLLQVTGKLARMGQIGYVDLVDTAYLYHEDEPKPLYGVRIDDAVKELHDWLNMLKNEFFNEEIKEKDLESAIASIDDVKNMSTYFLYTDKFDLTDLILEGNEILEYMENNLY